MQKPPGLLTRGFLHAGLGFARNEGITMAYKIFTVFTLNRGNKAPPNPTQLKNSEGLDEMKVDKINATEDARYDAMTDAQRDAYYVNPSLSTRLRKRFKKG
jgi:hypothetical protein